MISNYFKLIIRNLRKRSLFSLINIIGLAIGLASVMVIVSYVRDELSYDKFHSKHDRIYRITLDWLDDGKRTHLAAVEPPLTDVLNGKLTSIEKITRVFPLPALVSMDNVNKTKETGFCFADSVFFEIFDFMFLHGDRNTALSEPLSVVLTRSKALAYFGKIDVVGSELFYESDQASYTFQVTGVIEDFPPQSHFEADFVASFQSMDEVMPWYNSWYYPQMHTYLLAREGTVPMELENQINEEAGKNFPPQIEKGERTYYVQKISNIHLSSHLAQEWKANSSMTYVYVFGTIAIFILLIASINFMNLSTAQATTRAREVGLRKVMGAFRKQLISYFLGEAVLITIVSFIVGFALAEWVLLGGLNRMLERQLTLDFAFSLEWIAILIGSVIVIGVISGCYPAFFLSRFKPVNTLKGVIEKPGKELTMRMWLVVFQFIISGTLFIFTWVVVSQNSFMVNKQLGFDKDHIVSIRLNDAEVQRNYSVLKNSLLEAPGVEAASLSSALPGNDEFYGFSIIPEAQVDEVTISTLGVDEDYIKTYGINLLAGRDFSISNKADEDGAYIINQAAAKSLGWDDPIGKDLTFVRHTNKREEKKGKVIGLVEDFHFKSLHHQVEPLLIYINRHAYYADYLSVRFSAISPDRSIELLQDSWKKAGTEKPLEFIFMDSQLDQYYHGEMRRAKVFTSFAGLSIFVSCLGLFGLAAFSMQQRRREIGIRKILGASVLSLLSILSMQFLKLILLANLIAWPIAWYMSDVWLQNFAYHITPGIGVFVFSLLATAAIALLTIIFQTLSTASLNPIETIRDE